ncbi:hypothetical protein [Sphingopyxis sp. C-1]|uniref:hypothetical protein n=1 Tax=Sphingopyxis sp. C-1 TaxID=262667 RepID=UPI0006C5C827|nr:hypothetical protein [Sphingopyxis sp. C-1]GAO78656.1 hypothetical protein SC1_01965 [Sphingopyxis sp. C-1]
MKKFLLDFDPLHGVRQYYGVDTDGQEYLIDEIDAPTTKAVIDHNKRIEGTGMGHEMRLAASVPVQVQYEWLDKYGINMWDPNHKQGVVRLLNSNEYRYLRVNHFMM